MKNEDELIDALRSLAYQLGELGKGNASGDERGAIEFLAIEIHAGLSEVAEALGSLAQAVAHRR